MPRGTPRGGTAVRPPSRAGRARLTAWPVFVTLCCVYPILLPDSGAAAITATRRRVACALSMVIAGFLIARSVPAIGAPWWFGAGLAATLIGAATRGWSARLALGAAAALVAGGWWAARIHQAPADSAALLVSQHGERVLATVEGTVLGTPRRAVPDATALGGFERRQARTRFDVRLSRIESAGGFRVASGTLWVGVAGDPPRARAGDRVRLTGFLAGIDGPDNPGEGDLRPIAAQTGHVGTLQLTGASLVVALEEEAGWWARAGAWRLRAHAAVRDRAAAVVARTAGRSPEAHALLAGLLLGAYDPAERDVRDVFARQGLAHALSISGFHLAVMAALALFALRLTGDRGGVEPLAVGALVAAYALLVPASSPVARSAAMVLALLVAEGAGRRHDRLTVLGWIAMALLAWRPADLFALGPQLSVGLTAALFWLAAPVRSRLFREPLRGLVAREPTWRRWLADKGKDAVAAGLVCWLASAPVVLLRVGLLSPLAALTTLVVTPLIAALLWLGYLALLAGMVLPALADAASGVMIFAAEATIATVRLADAAPLSAVWVPPVPALWALGATAATVLWLRRGDARDGRMWLVAAVLAAWAGGHWAFAGRPARGVALRLDAFAVGNGTSFLLRSGGEAVLWDCGATPGGGGGVLPGVVERVRALGVGLTPVAVVTHPDLDHFGGLPEAAQPLGVRLVLVPARFVAQAEAEPAGAAAVFMGAMRAAGVEVRAVGAGARLGVGEATVEFLAPAPGAAFAGDNDHSLVARVTVRDGTSRAGTLLLTGDVQDDGIGALLAAHGPLAADVLELPHHGSARSVPIAFAAAVDPGVVVQSTGPSRVGDPRWDGVRGGRAWHTTATGGAASIEFRDDGRIVLRAFRGRERDR